MVIFNDLQEYGKRLDEKSHQRYLNARGITEEQFQEEKRREKEDKIRKHQEKLEKPGLTEEQYKKRKDRISTIGCCIAPILAIGCSLLLYYTIMLFFTETSIGQTLGYAFVGGYLVFLIGIVIIVLSGIWYAAYSQFESKSVGTLVGIIALIAFIFVMLSIPKSCVGNPDNYDYDRSLHHRY